MMDEEEGKEVLCMVVVVLVIVAVIGFLFYRYPRRSCIVCGHMDYDGRMNRIHFSSTGDVYVCDECAPVVMKAVMELKREGDR